MPLPNVEYIKVPEKKQAGKQSKLKDILKELVESVNDLKQSKQDTTNLKNNYKEFAEQTNASMGVLKAKIDALESLVKSLVERLDDFEQIDF
jgi:ABC-type transporter Mla subunit MlaD